MTGFVNNNGTNINWAEGVLRNGPSDPHFDMAMEQMSLYDPDNELLKKWKGLLSDGNKKQIMQTLDAIVNDKPDSVVLGEKKADLTTDDEINQNMSAIDGILHDIRFLKKLSVKMNKDSYNVEIMRDGSVLGEGDGKSPVELQDEKNRRKKVLKEALSAAKHEVLVYYSQDKEFSNNSQKQKEEILLEKISEVFEFKLGKAFAASSVKSAEGKEAIPGTKENKAYSEKALEDMRAALEAFYVKDSKKKVVIDEKFVLQSVAKTGAQLNEFKEEMQEQGYKKAAHSARDIERRYDNRRRVFWHKKYNEAKGFLLGLKNNWKRIATTFAVIGAATIAAPAFPVASAAAISLYMAGGAFAWQIHDERRNMQAQRGRSVSLREAAKNIFDDKNKRRNFLVNGAWGVASGIAGGALFGWAATGGMAAYLGLNSSNAVNAALSSASRVTAMTAGSNSALGTNYLLAKKEYKANSTKENKRNALLAKKHLKYGLGASVLTGAITAVTAYDGIGGAIHGSGVDAVSGDAVKAGAEAGNAGASAGASGTPPFEGQNPYHQWNDSTLSGGEGGNITPQGDGIVPQGGAGAEISGATEYTPVEVPTEWNPNMGISENHWKMLMERFENSDITFEEAYLNAYNAQQAHPELFEDMSIVEAVDKFVLNDSWYKDWEAVGVFEDKGALIAKGLARADAKVIDVTDFENVTASDNYIYHHQITTIDANGEPVVHDFYASGKGGLAILQKHDTLYRLQRMIKCGDDIDISANNANELLEKPLQQGDRNIRMVRVKPCDEGYEYRGTFAHKHTNVPTAHASVNETVVNNQQPAQPVNVEEVTVHVEKQPAPQSMSYKVTRYTTYDNTAGSGSVVNGKGMPEQVVARGTVTNSGR